jgi:hypothetical protein
MLAPTGLSAQKRVIKVQGHPHELLTQKHGGKEDAITRTREVTGSTANINLADITCWAGGVDPTIDPQYIDSAVLLVKWTDQKALSRGDSILIWGYRWNTITISVNPDGSRDTFPAATRYTIDMIRAVGNADCAFSALLQNTSAGNFTAGGFGYNFASPFERVPVQFNATGAKNDSRIKFGYEYPNCNMSQGTVPYDVYAQATEAIRREEADFSSTGIGGTGIIRHPFDADYGYPAYDYDYWTLTNPGNLYYEWQAGWYNGYWAFYVKPDLNGNFTYSGSGIATQGITNHSVSGFVFAINMDWSKDMSGDYTARPCVCTCHPPVRENVTGSKRK